MRSVKIEKQRLLEKLRENREEHHRLYVDVEIAYRKAVIKEAYEIVRKADSGETFNRCIRATEPTDHTDDYDRAISMLEYSTEDIVEITDNEFDQFVLNKWDWSGLFGDTYTDYMSQ